MNAVAQLFDAATLLLLLAKASLMLTFAWVLQLLLSRAHPYWRLLIWRTCVIGLLLFPLSLCVGPLASIKMPILPPEQGVSLQPAFPLPAVHTVPDSSETQGLAGLESLDINTNSLGSWPALTHSLIRKTDNALIVVWIAGVVALLLRSTLHARHIKRQIRCSKPLSREGQRLYESVSRDLSVRSPLSVVSVTGLGSPFVSGWLRPVVALPDRIVSQSNHDTLAGVLAHEIAHVKTRDVFWFAVIRFMSNILWFHPLAWKVHAAHYAACEEAADAAAVRYLGNGNAYARILAWVALTGLEHQQAGGPAMAALTHLQTRLARIRDGRFTCAPARWTLGATYLVAGVAAMGVASIAVTAAESTTNPMEAASRTGIVIVGQPDLSGHIAGLKHQEAEAGRPTIWTEADLSAIPWSELEKQTFARSNPDTLVLFRTGVEPQTIAALAEHVRPDRLYVFEDSLQPEAIETLSRLTSLKALRIAGRALTADEMARLTRLTSLEELIIATVTDEALAPLKDMPVLRDLHLNNIALGRTGARHLEQLNHLQSLYLQCEYLTEGCMHDIADMPSLRELSLNDVEFSTAGMQALSGAKRLEKLSIWGIVTNDGVRYIAQMPRLQELLLCGRALNDDLDRYLSDEGLAYLTACDSLVSLHLYYGRFSDGGLGSLSNMTTLQTLVIPNSGARLSDAGLARLCELPNLQTLQFRADLVSDKGLEALRIAPSLRHVELFNQVHSPVTKDGIARLAAARPDLEIET